MNDPTTPESLHTILFKLVQRVLSQSQTPSSYHAERFHLHVTVLKELKLYDEAYKMVETDAGKIICANNLACEELCREIWKLQGLVKEAGEHGEKQILKVK